MTQSSKAQERASHAMDQEEMKNAFGEKKINPMLIYVPLALVVLGIAATVLSK